MRYGLGLLPDGRVVGTPSSSSASSGKCPNIRKCTLFPKWACLKFPEMSIFQKSKPLREHPNKGELFRTYLHKINSCSQSSQKVTFTNFRFFGNVLRYQDTFLPKTKMVPVVHMNIFYRMDLEIYDSKSEL